MKLSNLITEITSIHETDPYAFLCISTRESFRPYVRLMLSLWLPEATAKIRARENNDGAGNEISSYSISYLYSLEHTQRLAGVWLEDTANCRKLFINWLNTLPEQELSPPTD